MRTEGIKEPVADNVNAVLQKALKEIVQKGDVWSSNHAKGALRNSSSSHAAVRNHIQKTPTLDTLQRWVGKSVAVHRELDENFTATFVALAGKWAMAVYYTTDTWRDVPIEGDWYRPLENKRDAIGLR